ncbi:metallophosphoesterase [Kineosporia sp. J2-2]|uniref:Metallophosphoesterase n=1 Tax=Kineosporia corallincola TaxID=2835133 RepID=A0ABS5TE72_9ACTN|nr:metallophosphoesterase [Kineosporia corallincola]MBT0769377.1 metallophosphoesterase [Kineosporia corallincola]
MITFAHISDLHIDLRERATERARRLVAALRPMHDLDAVLVTGDIADHGTAPEYDLVRELLEPLRVPVLVLPGNHDVRETFGPGLLGLPSSGREINQAVTVAGVDFLLCDSVIPRRSDGELSDATLNWMKAALDGREGDGPVMVAFHHPPAVLHIPTIDRIRQHGEQRLAGLLKARPEVAAVLCGHAHTAATTLFAGRPLVVGPGCVSTTLHPAEPGAQNVVSPDAPPGYALHVLDDEARLVTHFRAV